jgi:hypothetical protein
VAYRVYRVPEGCDEEFCGEFTTRAEAVSCAKKGQSGIPRGQWGTASAAGQCGGRTSPGEGEETEPIGWYGDHCLVQVVDVLK